MRERSAVRSATSRGVATTAGPPSASRMHGSNCAISLPHSPAANSSWIRTTRSTAAFRLLAVPAGRTLGREQSCFS